MDTFLDQIYGTTKGEVRLHVLWLDMLAEVPALKDGGLRVIDIGAGKGQIARRLGELGHEVTLCEPSGDLLEEARQGFTRQASLRTSSSRRLKSWTLA